MTKRIINIKPGESVEIRMSKNEDKDYFTIQEVADKVGLNYFTVHRHIKEGHLLVEKIGRSNRISKENLETYLKTRK